MTFLRRDKRVGLATQTAYRPRIFLLDLILLTTLFAIALTIWLDYHARFPFAARSPDAEDIAQIARHVARGEGMQTDFMPLNGLEFLRQRDWHATTWPNITRFPVMILVQAGLFRLVGVGEDVLVLSSSIFYFLSLPLTYVLGVRLGGRLVGGLAGLMYITNDELVRDSLHGLTEPAAGFLLLLLFLVLSRVRSPRGAVYVGGLFALAMLNRYDFLPFALPISVYLIRRASGWRNVLAFGVSALVVLLPWIIYTTIITGEPLFNLQSSSTIVYDLHPIPHTNHAGKVRIQPEAVLGWYRPTYTSPLAVILHDSNLMLAKFVYESKETPPTVGDDMLQIFWLVVVACVAALARRHQAPITAQLLAVLVGCIVLQFLLVNTIGYTLERHYRFFLPIVIVFCVNLLVSVARAWMRAPTGALALASVLLAAVFQPTWIHRYPASDPGPYVDMSPSNQRILSSLPPDSVVASNRPWAVAWYSDIHAIPLPLQPASILAFEQRYGLKIGALYLANPSYFNDAPPEWFNLWEPLRRDCKPFDSLWRAVPLSGGACIYMRIQ